jgi:hypothetical protein
MIPTQIYYELHYSKYSIANLSPTYIGFYGILDSHGDDPMTTDIIPKKQVMVLA